MPDWMITNISDHGAGSYYRFHVEGRNLSDDGQYFSWSVRDIESDRFAPLPEAGPVVAAAVAAAKSVTLTVTRHGVSLRSEEV